MALSSGFLVQLDGQASVKSTLSHWVDSDRVPIGHA